jgi:hypothetical protein
MLTTRSLALPAIALAVIVALAQAHSQTAGQDVATPSVHRAVSCEVASGDAACTFAGNARTSVVR